MLRPPSHSSLSLHPQSQFEAHDEIVDTPGWGANHAEIRQSSTPVDESIYCDPIDEWVAGPSQLDRRNTHVIEQIKNFVPRPLELHEEEEADLLFDEDERRFINLSLLSNLAVQLYDNVPRGTHVKGSVPYPRAFTGKDVVVCRLYIYSTWFVLFLTGKGNSQPYIPLYNGNWFPTMVPRQRIGGLHF